MRGERMNKRHQRWTRRWAWRTVSLPLSLKYLAAGPDTTEFAKEEPIPREVLGCAPMFCELLWISETFDLLVIWVRFVFRAVGEGRSTDR